MVVDGAELRPDADRQRRARAARAPSTVSPTVSATSVPVRSAPAALPGNRRASTSTRTASPPRADTTPPAPAPATHAATTSRRRGGSSSVQAACDDGVPATPARDLVGQVQRDAQHQPARRHTGDGIDQAVEGTLESGCHVGHSLQAYPR